MKELYIAPELQVTCFAPVERLAADGEINFDDLFDTDFGLKGSAGKKDEDLELDL